MDRFLLLREWAKPVGGIWIAAGVGGIGLGIGLVVSGSFNFWQDKQAQTEKLAGLQAELASINFIDAQANALVETTSNVTASLDNLTSEWDGLQSNIKMINDVVNHEDVNNLKVQFEEASFSWLYTQVVSDAYNQLEENGSDSIELDLDEINTEEEYEEALKEAHDADELIDVSELTDEELEELLRELLEEEQAA